MFRRVWDESGESYEGAMEGSPFFWGDLCRAHVEYVRNFTFTNLDLLKVNPEMPYRRTNTAYVKYWFSTSDAEDVQEFNRLLTVERIDSLEATGGVCIISTHLGKGYARNGKLHTDTAKILRYLSTKDGWFPPVSDLLDHAREARPRYELHDLSEQRLANIHMNSSGWLPRGTYMVFGKRSSSRHQTKTAYRPHQCLIFASARVI